MLSQVFALLCLVIYHVSAHAGHHELEPPHVAKALRAASEQFRSKCNKRTSACVLQNEVTEGPYYYDTELIRQDITEGQSGISLVLNLTVIDPTTCSPIENAAVDIWHANATGVYSHFVVSGNNGGTNTTFLRGMKTTDSNGNVQIDTIFPGWYSGRVVHIHVKVHVGGTVTSAGYVGGNVVHTGQLFFAQTVLDSVATLSPYSSNTQTRSTLSSDGIYSQAGSVALLDVTYMDSISNGAVASSTLGVDPSATTTTTNSGGSNSGPPPSGANLGGPASSSQSQSSSSSDSSSSGSSSSSSSSSSSTTYSPSSSSIATSSSVLGETSDAQSKSAFFVLAMSAAALVSIM